MSSIKRVKGHALSLEWSGERGSESSSTGICKCGWEESASSQLEVRHEYRHHLKREAEKLKNKQEISSQMNIFNFKK